MTNPPQLYASLVLTDSIGTILDIDPSDSGFYTIDTTGPDTVYFYLDWERKIAFELSNIRITVSTAVTLEATLELLVLGAWREAPAYATGTLTTVQSQMLNTLYPLTENIPLSSTARVAATVSDTTTISVNATTR